jgi:hypothetical protein
MSMPFCVWGVGFLMLYLPGGGCRFSVFTGVNLCGVWGLQPKALKHRVWPPAYLLEPVCS